MSRGGVGGTPTGTRTLSNQENESESERNRRRHLPQPETPAVQKRLAFSAVKPPRKSPATGQTSGEKRRSPGVFKSITKERRTPYERYRTPRTIRVRGMTGKSSAVPERRQFQIFEDYQEVALTKWVNSLLSTCDNTSCGTPLGSWDQSTVFKSRLHAMCQAFLKERDGDSQPVTNDTLASLREVLSTGRVRMKSGISLRSDGARRSQITALLASTYGAHWLVCALSVASGTHLGARYDERRHCAGVLEDDERSEAVLHTTVEVLVSEYVFAGLNDADVSVCDFNASVLYRVFTLIYLLDTSKMCHFDLFDNDPPLFRIECGVKSSEDVVRKFGHDFIAYDGDDLCRHLARKGYALRFSATQVEHKYNLSTQNIVEGYNDGVRFGKLVSVVLRDPGLLLKMDVLDGGSFVQKREQVINDRNFPRALVRLWNFIAMNDKLCRGVHFPEPKNAHEISSSQGHRRKPLLDALWNVSDLYARIHLLNDQVPLPNGGATTLLLVEIDKQMDSLRQLKNSRNDPLNLKHSRFTPDKHLPAFHDPLESELRKQLMRWVQVVCYHYEVSVTDSTECFRDGAVLCLLLHHYYPQVVKLDDITIVKLFGTREPGSDEQELKHIRENYNVFRNGARQLGGIPMLHLNAKVAVKRKSEKKSDTFGNVMYLLTSYIFKRVVQFPIADIDLDGIHNTLEETARSTQSNVTLKATYSKLANTPRSRTSPSGWNSPRERQTPTRPQHSNQFSRNPSYTPLRSIANSPTASLHSSPMGRRQSLGKPPIAPTQDRSYNVAAVVQVQRVIRSHLTTLQVNFYREKRESAAFTILRHWRAFAKHRRSNEMKRKMNDFRKFYTDTNESTSLLVTQVRRMFSTLEDNVRTCRYVSRTMNTVEKTQAAIQIQQALRRTLVTRAIAPVIEVFHQSNNATTTSHSVDVHPSHSRSGVSASLSTAPNLNFTAIASAITAGGAILGGLAKLYQAAENRSTIVYDALETAATAFDTTMKERFLENARRSVAATTGLAAISFAQKKFNQEHTQKVTQISREIRTANQAAARATETWERWQNEPEVDAERAKEEHAIFAATENALRRHADAELAYIAADNHLKREVSNFNEVYGKFAKLVEQEAVRQDRALLSQQEIEADRERAELELVQFSEKEGVLRVQRSFRTLFARHHVEELSRSMFSTKLVNSCRALIAAQVAKQHQAKQEFANVVYGALETATAAFGNTMQERLLENELRATQVSAGLAAISSAKEKYTKEVTQEMSQLRGEISALDETVRGLIQIWQQWHDETVLDITAPDDEQSSKAAAQGMEQAYIMSDDRVQQEICNFDEAYANYEESIRQETACLNKVLLSEQQVSVERERSELELVRIAKEEGVERLQKSARTFVVQKRANDLARSRAVSVLLNVFRAISATHLVSEIGRTDAATVVQNCVRFLSGRCQENELFVANAISQVQDSVRRFAAKLDVQIRSAAEEVRQAERDADVGLNSLDIATDRLRKYISEYGLSHALNIKTPGDTPTRRNNEAEQMYASSMELVNGQLAIFNEVLIKHDHVVEEESRLAKRQIIEEMRLKQEQEAELQEQIRVARLEAVQRVQTGARVVLAEHQARRNATIIAQVVSRMSNAQQLADRIARSSVSTTLQNSARFVSACTQTSQLRANSAISQVQASTRQLIAGSIIKKLGKETQRVDTGNEEVAEDAFPMTGNTVNVDDSPDQLSGRNCSSSLREHHEALEDIRSSASKLWAQHSPMLGYEADSEPEDNEEDVGATLLSSAEPTPTRSRTSQTGNANFGLETILEDSVLNEALEGKESEFVTGGDGFPMQTPVDHKTRPLFPNVAVHQGGKENQPGAVKGMHTESARRLAREVVEGAKVTQAAIRGLSEELAAIARGFEDEMGNNNDSSARKISTTIRRLSRMLSPAASAGRALPTTAATNMLTTASMPEVSTTQSLNTQTQIATPESLTMDSMRLALVVVKGCVERDHQRRHVLLALRLLDKLTLPLKEIRRFVQIGYSFDVIVTCASTCFDMPNVLSGCICLLKKMGSHPNNRAYIARNAKSVKTLAKLCNSLAAREKSIQATETRTRNSSRQLNELVKRGIPVPSELFEDVEAVYSNEIRTLWKELKDVSKVWVNAL